MGNTYVNFTLRGPIQQAVGGAVTGRSAFITPVRNGAVVLIDQASEESFDVTELGTRLSRDLNCPVLAVIVYDGDVLYYRLFEQGEQTDEYDSSDRQGGDAHKLCSAFGVQNMDTVEGILRTGRILDNGGYKDEIFRHEALCQALNLPNSVNGGYQYVSQGDLPPCVVAGELLKIM